MNMRDIGGKGRRNVESTLLTKLAKRNDFICKTQANQKMFPVGEKLEWVGGIFSFFSLVNRIQNFEYFNFDFEFFNFEYLSAHGSGQRWAEYHWTGPGNCNPGPGNDRANRSSRAHPEAPYCYALFNSVQPRL